MKKHFLKILFLVAMVIGLSLTAFGQKSGDKKTPKKKNPPKILVPKKKSPKKKKKKKKNGYYSKFVRSEIYSNLS